MTTLPNVKLRAVGVPQEPEQHGINGLFKADVIHRRGPWKTREAVELATLSLSRCKSGSARRSDAEMPGHRSA